jgi:hypothetical protein
MLGFTSGRRQPGVARPSETKPGRRSTIFITTLHAAFLIVAGLEPDRTLPPYPPIPLIHAIEIMDRCGLEGLMTEGWSSPATAWTTRSRPRHNLD